MCLILLILLALQLTQIDAQISLPRSFLQWKQQLGKNYAGQAEQLYRFYIYNQNLQRMNQHNSKPDRTYDQGMNKFSDLTRKEFQATYLTLLPPPINKVNAGRINNLKQEKVLDSPITGPTDRFSSNSPPIMEALAKQDDWNDFPIIKARRCITFVDFSVPTVNNTFPAPVRDQGGCGSCYAFSALSIMSATLSLKKKTRYEFSPQEIVDCDNPTNFGCEGGWFSGVYDYAKLYAVSSESTYPYTSGSTGVTGTCNTTARGKGLFKLKSYKIFDAKQTFALLRLNLFFYGPQSIGVAANDAWYSYDKGVVSISDCPADELNHGVMLMGFDSCGNIKIQNTWGRDWGMSGFIWLNASNNANVCNIYGYPTYLPVF